MSIIDSYNLRALKVFLKTIPKLLHKTICYGVDIKEFNRRRNFDGWLRFLKLLSQFFSYNFPYPLFVQYQNLPHGNLITRPICSLVSSASVILLSLWISG